MSSPNLRERRLDLGLRRMASISVAVWGRYVPSVTIGKRVEVRIFLTVSACTGEPIDDSI